MEKTPVEWTDTQLKCILESFLTAHDKCIECIAHLLEDFIGRTHPNLIPRFEKIFEEIDFFLEWEDIKPLGYSFVEKQKIAQAMASHQLNKNDR